MASGKVLLDFIDFDIKKNDNTPKFKDDDAGFIKVFVVKNVKNTVQWTYVLETLKNEEVAGTFYEK